MPRIPARIVTASATAVASSRSVRAPAMAYEQTGDRQVNALQRAATKANSPAASSLIGNHNILQGLAFVSGVPQILNHGLGTACLGAFVTRSASAPALYFVPLDAGLDPALQVKLQSDTTDTLDVLVFG